MHDLSTEHYFGQLLSDLPTTFDKCYHFEHTIVLPTTFAQPPIIYDTDFADAHWHFRELEPQPAATAVQSDRSETLRRTCAPALEILFGQWNEPIVWGG